MLETLEEKVDPNNAALIVVDMQNDFCSPGGAFDRLGYDMLMVKEMIPRLVGLVSEARKVNLPVVFLKSTYNTIPNWYLSEVWFEHKMRRQSGIYSEVPALKEGTLGWEIIDELKPLPTELVVCKNRYDGFLHTNLDLVLRNRGIRSVIMTGVSTNVCVETTTREAFLRDYYVVFTKDCTASYERDLHEATLKNVDKYFGIVVASEDILKSWNRLTFEVKTGS